MGSKQGVIEKHTFINHTSCHCVDRTSIKRILPPRIMQNTSVFPCACPKVFEKVLQENGECRCDCSSGNAGCDYMKKGEEHFGMDDRKWVTTKIHNHFCRYILQNTTALPVEIQYHTLYTRFALAFLSSLKIWLSWYLPRKRLYPLLLYLLFNGETL